MKTLDLRNRFVRVVSYLIIGIIVMQLLATTLVAMAIGIDTQIALQTQNTQHVEYAVITFEDNKKLVTSYEVNMNSQGQKTVPQPAQRSLEEILADPNSKIIELIPYLQGSYEENVEILAHLMQGECRDGSDESMQYAALIAIARAFDKQASDGMGNLESAIFMDGQYTCTWDGSFYQTPSEDCYRNARAVLNQDLLDPTAPINLFFMATVRFSGKPVYTTLQEGGKTVYIQYKW